MRRLASYLKRVTFTSPSAGIRSWEQYTETSLKLNTTRGGRNFAGLPLWPSAPILSLANRRRMAIALQEWELATAAVVCSITDTRSGQRLLGNLLPMAAMVYLFPSRFHSRALQLDDGGGGGDDSIDHNMRWAPQLRQQPNSSSWRGLLAQCRALAIWVVDEIGLCLRSVYLAALFAPMLIAAPLVFSLGMGGADGRAMWMDLVLWTIERAGPAFIKWAQWSASRPDLFPPDLCQRFERLQNAAPAHSASESTSAVAAAFREVEEAGGGRDRGGSLFESFEAEPVASGSIAQVHRAALSPYGAQLTGGRAGQVVAVKVRHPGVSGIIRCDFVLMQRAARLCSLLPGLAELRLDESIRQFGGPLKEQLDLSIEARHLRRFNHNFRRWHNVSFPVPLYPLVAPTVLVETFEEGLLISRDVNQEPPCSTEGERHQQVRSVSGSSASSSEHPLPVATRVFAPESIQRRSHLAMTGLSLYLQMLLKDNFCHADLHPGNILVREAADAGDMSSLSRSVASWGHAALRSLSSLLRIELRDPLPRLVLLDAGMIAELKPADQGNLVGFFRALTRQEGENIGRSILALSERRTCKDPDAFVADMKLMFDSLDAETIRAHTAEVFRDMIETLRRHHVTLKSTVSTIVVTTLVLEGWSSKLDPDLHILDTMREMLSGDDAILERVGRVVDRICHSPAPTSLFA